MLLKKKKMDFYMQNKENIIAKVLKFSADRENFIVRFVKRQNAVLRNWKTK